MTTTETFCPSNVATAVQFGNKDVLCSLGSQGRIPEGGAALETACGVDVAATIGGDAVASVIAGTTETFRPSDVATAVLFGYEDVIASLGSQGRIPKGGAALEIACGVEVAATVGDYANSIVGVDTTETFCPSNVAISVLFGYEDVIASLRSQGRSPEGGAALESACSVDVGDVAATVGNDVVAYIEPSTTETFRPNNIGHCELL
ncbi:hypothetical protein IQ264_20340 [Phormidium sp. LEGE 05292]|uniref:hypothetical protein n=1 Tax=[Phormidium] sp. LEGE 05292 TaxID=767427 RepID=UPI00187FA38F|nr:hypothetical protein [Phormidium sp. LEGE 05292]MBE9227778.1 hypothetical protein [Phormidium sp. LEGE 05292]